MATFQSQLFIGGGQSYNATARTWDISSEVFSLDFSLGSNMKWRKLDGGDGSLVSSSTQTYADSSMAYSDDNNQLMLHLPTDLYFVPITARLASNTIAPNSAEIISSVTLVNALISVYDGDTIVLDNVQLINIDPGVVIAVSAGVFIQGNTYTNSLVKQEAIPSDTSANTTSSSNTTSSGNTTSSDNTAPTSGQNTTSGSNTTSPGGGGARRRLYHVASGRWRNGVPQFPALPAAATQALAQPEDLLAPAHQRKLLVSLSSLVQVASQPGSMGGVMLDAVVTSLLAQYAGLWSGTYTVVDCQSLQLSTAFNFSAGSSTVANLLIKNCQDTAVVVTGTAGVSFVKTIFYNNMGTHGGALRIEGQAQVNLTDCVFLNNTADTGSAIFVAAGATLLNTDTTSFHGNGQGDNAENGAAIYTKSGCIANITDSVFAWNGVAQGMVENGTGVSTKLSQGGALWLESPACSLAVTGSVFKGNAVVQNGGAVTATAIGSGTTLSFTSCTFTSNTAGGQGVSREEASGSVGGALYLRTVYGKVSLSSSTFTNNSARRSGGGVYGSLVTLLTGTDLQFYNNSVDISAGGAWYMEKDGNTSISGTYFMGNTAKYGGALAANRDVYMQVSECGFTSNTALDLGGGVEGDACAYLGLSGCSFSDNRAGSAGGAALVDLTAGNVTGCAFIRNSAHTGQEAATSCARGVMGAGGAMCMKLQGEVVVTNSTFLGNAATNGGALHLTQTCAQSEDGACDPVLLGSPGALNFTDNSAEGGGGGVIWVYEFDDMNMTCANGTALSVDSGTPSCDEWQTAAGQLMGSYGDALVTAATSLQFIEPTSGLVDSYLSSTGVQSYLDAKIAVMDAFNQTIAGGSPEAMAQFTATLVEDAQFPYDGTTDYSASLSGSTVEGAQLGLANFDNMRMKGKAGVYAVRYSVTGLLHSDISTIDLAVHVRWCLVGETTNEDAAECNPCKINTYTMTNDSLACNACPTEADCYYDGKDEEAVPVGAVLVPSDGYWHSHPQSGQIHECVYSPACSGDAWRDSREQLLQYQKQLVYSNITLNETEYNLLQCKQGYYGNLCAGCIDGYGRQGKGICAKCPAPGANAIFYILANLLSVLLVIITIRAQLQAQDREDAEVSQEEQQAASRTTARLTALANLLRRLLRWMKRDGGDSGRHGDDDDKEGSDADAGDGDAGEREDQDASGDSIGGPGSKRSGPGAWAHLQGPAGRQQPSGGDQQPQQGQQPQEDARGLTRLGSGKEQSGTNSAQSEGTSPPQAIAMKIFINYLQIAAIVKGVDLTWPDVIQSYLDASDTVSNGVGTMVSLDCSLSGTTPKSIQAAIITVITPLLIMAFAVPTWLLIWLNMLLRKGALNAPQFREYMSNRLTITVISVVFFFYANVTRQILSIFSCPTVDSTSGGEDDGSTLRAVGDWWTEDYNVKCYKGPHLVLVLALGVPGVLLFCIGVPIASALFLRHNRQRLHDKSFLATFGFLYGDYEDHFYFWESCVMARKFVIVVVVVFLTNVGTDMQLMVSLGVIVVAMVAHMLCAPFRIGRLDRVEFLSLWGSTLLIYVAMYFVIASSSHKLKGVLSFVLLIVNILLTVLLAFQVVKEWMWSALKDMDMDHDGWLSRADVQLYLAKMRRRKKGTKVYIAQAIAWLLEAMGSSPRMRRVALRLFLYPCEHLATQPQLPSAGAGDTSSAPGAWAASLAVMSGKLSSKVAPEPQADKGEPRKATNKFDEAAAVAAGEQDVDGLIPAAAAAAGSGVLGSRQASAAPTLGIPGYAPQHNSSRSSSASSHAHPGPVRNGSSLLPEQGSASGLVAPPAGAPLTGLGSRKSSPAPQVTKLEPAASGGFFQVSAEAMLPSSGGSSPHGAKEPPQQLPGALPLERASQPRSMVQQQQQAAPSAAGTPPATGMRK